MSQKRDELLEIEKEMPVIDETCRPTEERQTPEEIESDWFKNVYKGDDMPQLTLRAVIMGSFLGGFMSLSNLYVGLKTGWGLGVAITACILSFSIYRTLVVLLPRFFRTEMSILENNCMQSTASSAGYSTGGTMVSAVAAYLLLTGTHIPWTVLVLWTFFLAALGVFMAVPMKRQMINREQLKFPSGIAAAETLRSLHSREGEAIKKARSLGLAALFGAVLSWCRDAGRPSFIAIPSSLSFPGTLGGYPLDKWTVSFDMSSIMVAAGAIMGWRAAWSMLLGAIINYFILAPWALSLGAIDASNLGFRAIVQWSTWTGAAIMVTSALVYFAVQWRSVANALGGVGTLFRRSPVREKDPLARIEVPASWFISGTAISGLGCIAILYFFFGTAWWMGVVAVAMTFFLSLVAGRVTGDCDTTPLGSLGKVTQLAFGALAPGSVITNLMTAGVTAGAAGSSADLLTDLKSGYLLGANPRKQFIAQFLGIFAGTLVIVPAFYLLIPNAQTLGTDLWPAPAAQVWAAVARLLASGVDSLHPTARMGLLAGGIIGLALPLLEMYMPKYKKYIPSPTAFGLAMVIPFFNSLSMFLGALIALILEKKKPETASMYVIPVSSGLIAGESLMGVIVALLAASGFL